MGLFGKLFDKKNCAICGGEIGLLGNRKLEDGNLCKNCASRLSPWFSERRHSTVQEIEEQLVYREANYARVQAFRPTRQYGEDGCLFMDDSMQAFTVCRPNALTSGNPDIVDYSAFVSVKPEIIEHRWEDHDDPKDENRPPRFVYDYDFYITVYVNHPYFDDMRFQLNPFSIKQHDMHECMRYVRMTEDCVEAMCGERPNLADRIRPVEPEPMPAPIPVPMQSVHPVNHAGPHPDPRLMQQPAPQPRSQQAAPQPRPQQAAPQPRPQQAAPQGRPQQATPQARPQQTAPQGRPQQSAPQTRPANNVGPSGAGREKPSGRPGPQGGGPAGRR